MNEKKPVVLNIIGWLSGIVVLTIGVLNLVLVHQVPGTVGILFSLLYFPLVDDMIRKKFGRSIPPAVKIVLGIAIIWFTLGVSDLGDMID
jgi:hypothetical protein